MAAEIGRCELAGSGADCTGIPTEERTFVPLSDGDDVRIVVGPQAASMFVLGLRTKDIYPGDVDNPADPDNPDVSITLRSGQQMMAIYHGRPAFVPSVEDPGKFEQAAMFVVVDGNGSELVGLELTADVHLLDRDEQERCGQVKFIAALAGVQ